MSNELHLQLNKFLELLYKKTCLGYKRTKYANIHFASHICIDSCSEMNIGETWSISLPRTWSKVSSTKKKQVVNYFQGNIDLARSLLDKQLAFSSTLLEVNNKIQERSHLGRHTTLFHDELTEC